MEVEAADIITLMLSPTSLKTQLSSQRLEGRSREGAGAGEGRIVLLKIVAGRRASTVCEHASQWMLYNECYCMYCSMRPQSPINQVTHHSHNHFNVGGSRSASKEEKVLPASTNARSMSMKSWLLVTELQSQRSSDSCVSECPWLHSFHESIASSSSVLRTRTLL